MTKKRLSDLLRDEVQNHPDQADTPNATAEAAKSQPSSVSRTRRSNPTKADLEMMLEDLKTELAASQAQETELQETLTTLKQELTEQKNLVKKLQADLKEAEEYRSKFAHAEETIRQLTAVAPAVENKTVPETAPEIDYRSQRMLLKKLPEHSIDHSVQPRAMSQKLTNADIGWVD